jgi:hypothetical protein
VAGFCGYGDESSDILKGGEFIDYLSLVHRLRKKGSDPWSCTY